MTELGNNLFENLSNFILLDWMFELKELLSKIFWFVLVTVTTSNLIPWLQVNALSTPPYTINTSMHLVLSPVSYEFLIFVSEHFERKQNFKGINFFIVNKSLGWTYSKCHCRLFFHENIYLKNTFPASE